jgi:hypothetical protein
LIDSIETLERIANPKKPPLGIKKLKELREEYEQAEPEERAGLKEQLNAMETEFRCGRGSLTDLSPDLLDKLDKCFISIFLDDGEPHPCLFIPENNEYLDKYTKYCEDVDAIFDNTDGAPTYARHYFAQYSIWRVRDGLPFPVPLGTASVVHALHKIASKVRRGFTEVSRHVLLCCIHALFLQCFNCLNAISDGFALMVLDSISINAISDDFALMVFDSIPINAISDGFALMVFDSISINAISVDFARMTFDSISVNAISLDVARMAFDSVCLRVILVYLELWSQIC